MEEEMVTCELEAAEALAGLSRSSATRGDPAELSSQQGVVCRYNTTHTMVLTCSDNTDPQATKAVPGQLCSTSGQSNCVSKSRPKLTVAEKEARRVRRVLANRESAREAIRRRQAMYLELKRTAADVLEENGNLKKAKDLALKDYTSLKERNEFLKAQIPEKKQAKQRKTREETKTSEMSKLISSHKQPCRMACLWPSNSDVSQFHHDALSQHSTVAGSTQITQGGICACSHQGPGIIPLLVVPVPCVLPFLSPSSDNSGGTQTSHRCSLSSSDGEINQLSPNYIESDSMRTVPGFYQTPNVNFVSTPKSVVRNSLTMPQMNNHQELSVCSNKSSEKAYATAEARRRRKELMRMKDTNANKTRTIERVD